MQELEHWHPLLLSRELKHKPVGVQLAGREVVLFRTRRGNVSALTDRCAHRGMRLSCGRVEGEHLVCPYHGWRYDAEGRARCPSSPSMMPRTPSFEAVEHQGAVWVRARDSAAGALPDLMPPGFRLVGSLRERFDVPIEPLLDNFSEVEHVPTTHQYFGYTAESLLEIEIENTSTDRQVHTKFVGPSKRPLGLRLMDAMYGNWGIQTLTIEATNRFSPLYVELTVSQRDAKDSVRGPILKFFYFFVPTSATTTDLVGFVLWSGVGPMSHRLFARSILAMARREVLADKFMIERLAETGPSLKGFALTRFDVAVRENRRLLNSVYRGTQPTEPKRGLLSQVRSTR